MNRSRRPARSPRPLRGVRRPALAIVAVAVFAAAVEFAGPTAAPAAGRTIVFTDVVASGPGAGSGGDGTAAWVLRLDTPAGPLLHLAEVFARAGGAPGAMAAPVVSGGAAPVRATAEPTRPEEKAVATPLQWADPSGSLTIEGGVAEAQASARSATARAGFGTASGTGFAVANRLFTWEQQERLLAQVAALDAAVFDPLNARIAALTPALSAAGLATPRFEALSPMGLVDAGRGSLATASAEVATSDDFASGRADASLDQVRLLGGFVDARRISAEAAAERSAGGDDRRHGVWFGHLRIAGIAVVADGDRIRVADNDVASRAVVQPALDLLLGVLRDHGVELRVGERRDLPGGPEVTALSLTITAPDGPLQISVATARAELPALPPASPAPAGPPGGPDAGPAADAGPAPGAPSEAGGGRPGSDAPRAGSAAPAEPATDDLPAGAGSFDSVALPDGSPGPTGQSGLPASVSDGEAALTRASGTAATPARRPARPRLEPVATARSLRAVYLLLVVAGFAGALALPALVAPVTGRRSGPRSQAPSRRRRLP